MRVTDGEWVEDDYTAAARAVCLEVDDRDVLSDDDLRTARAALDAVAYRLRPAASEAQPDALLCQHEETGRYAIFGDRPLTRWTVVARGSYREMSAREATLTASEAQEPAHPVGEWDERHEHTDRAFADEIERLKQLKVEQPAERSAANDRYRAQLSCDKAQPAERYHEELDQNGSEYDDDDSWHDRNAQPAGAADVLSEADRYDLEYARKLPGGRDEAWTRVLSIVDRLASELAKERERYGLLAQDYAGADAGYGQVYRDADGAWHARIAGTFSERRIAEAGPHPRALDMLEAALLAALNTEDHCELPEISPRRIARAEAAESALAELRAKVEAWQRTAQQAHYEHGGVDWDALSALLGPR